MAVRRLPKSLTWELRLSVSQWRKNGGGGRGGSSSPTLTTGGLNPLIFPYVIIIIQSVDSISRDGPDTPIYNIIHYKKRNSSEQEKFKAFKLIQPALRQNTFLSIPRSLLNEYNLSCIGEQNYIVSSELVFSSLVQLQ